jgi:hypothetical protein
MAFPIIPKRRSGAAGNPTSLNLGELAVNTFSGKLYLGADGGVTEIGIPVAAGTTVTEHTANGTSTAFTFTGYNGTEDGGYIVSVGGIDQPPSTYSITSTAGGTITFVEAPVAGELISIRALVAGSGGGGSGDATSLQGRAIATTAPTSGQVLAWNATASQWQPTSLNGSVTFNTPGTHTWAVPAWVRLVYLDVFSGDGTAGTGTDGGNGSVGANAYFDDITGQWVGPTTGANGADGTGASGQAGKSVTISQLNFTLLGGEGGTAGTGGLGGGGSGGGGANTGTGYINAANGANGNGPQAGSGGNGATSTGPGTGGAGGGSGGNGSDGSSGGGGQGGMPGAIQGVYGGAGGYN